LISPFRDISDFEIILHIPGRSDLSGSVEPPDLLLKPRYQLDGRLNGAGQFVGELKINGESASIKRQLSVAGDIPRCGPISIEIRAWDRDREGLEPIAVRENMTISQIRRTLDAYCGVSIYRDGFRVHPYGEKGDDWLNLDLRSRQNPVRNLANNQIIGAIRISRDENPDLKDRSTREGMVKNIAHQDLEDWFRRILATLEETRYKARPRRETSTRTEPLFEAFDLAEAVREARTSLGAMHPVTRLIEEADQHVSRGVQQVQEVFSRLLMSAGLGHMVDIVIHEIGAPLGKINRQLVILERLLKKLFTDNSFETVKPSLESIGGWLEQIYHLRQRLDPQTAGRRGRAVTFDVADEIRLTFDLYQALIDKQKIDIDIMVPKQPVRVRMAKSVLAQVLANLVDNAMYWVAHKHGRSGSGRIHVDLRPLEHGFSVAVADNGPGIPENDRDIVFEPYYSTKPNGIGLGLYIARLLIESYGRLVYCENSKLSGACFEARFEQRVGL
jgi:signal transduction histidine kinase